MKIRNTELIKGRPQVAVSLMGKTYDEIIKECHAAVAADADVIEWRADGYISAVDNIDQKLIETDIYLEMLKILDEVRDIIEERPLIFTIRSKAQGGLSELNTEQTEGVQVFVAESGIVDLVDVEIRGFKKKNGGIGGRLLKDRVDKIHEAGSKVILSYHEFDEMIPESDIVRLVEAMTNYGGDIYKVAAMANNEEEAKALIRGTAELTKKGVGPIVTMAMGKEGAITRIIGGKYGSVITFAALEHASAPGQIKASQMKILLDRFYKA